MEGKLFALFKDLAEQLPAFLTLFACLIFAIARWRRHPKVSRLVLLGLGLLLLYLIGSSIVYNWVPDWFIESAAAADRERVVRNVYRVLGLVNNASLAVALAVLLTAIFAYRRVTSETT